jgi:hypothetical protein
MLLHPLQEPFNTRPGRLEQLCAAALLAPHTEAVEGVIDAPELLRHTGCPFRANVGTYGVLTDLGEYMTAGRALDGDRPRIEMLVLPGRRAC